ncbi:energy transducer TonB [Arachidicoccus terrestris]|uniref:energy transducer TonB n=1 Tax=Arachidicoccus terrestris TaxID=2875539 RepID=UPI001CC57A15|nr:energy transducer TonB [Arachidicoccus terrestris]UAY56673.1 energy transducer TonB [Arachidicoccus terrestris]
MDAKDIMRASQLDILFDGKNKDYGAYTLRKNYHKRIELAMVVTGLLVLLFVGGTLLPHKQIEPAAPQVFVGPTVKLKTYKKPEKPKVIPPPTTKAPLKVAMQKLTVPNVVDDRLVRPDEMPPKQTDKIKVGPVTQTGVNMDGLLTAPPEVKGISGNGKGMIGSVNDNADYQKEFKVVQVEARYPGGQEAWKKYLERNLRRQVAVDNGASPGLYAVVVSFLVARDGSTSEVTVVSAPDPDFGTAAEAIRVIEHSGKWQPAIQNGRSVIYRERQKIIFQVSE